MKKVENSLSWAKGSIDRIIAIFLSVVLIYTVYSNFQLKKTLASAQGDRDIPSTLIQLQVQASSQASQFLGKSFPIHQLPEIVSKKNKSTQFLKRTIVLLFHSSDCSSCLDNELQLLQNAFEKYGAKGVFDILAIGAAPSEYELIVIRKVSKVKFPVLYDMNQEILQELSLQIQNLPMVFLVNNVENRIINAYRPIPNVNKYSEIYMNEFISFLMNHQGH